MPAQQAVAETINYSGTKDIHRVNTFIYAHIKETDAAIFLGTWQTRHDETQKHRHIGTAGNSRHVTAQPLPRILKDVTPMTPVRAGNITSPQTSSQALPLRHHGTKTLPILPTLNNVISHMLRTLCRQLSRRAVTDNETKMFQTYRISRLPKVWKKVHCLRVSSSSGEYLLYK